MTEPINLNKYRKAKAKAEKTNRAAQNRAKFGRTKAEKALEKSKADKAAKQIDDHKTED